MKSLEYDKMGLQEEIEEFQVRVKHLIEQERRLLESVDMIQAIKLNIISEIRDEAAKLRFSLEDKIHNSKQNSTTGNNGNCSSVNTISKFELPYSSFNYTISESYSS